MSWTFGISLQHGLLSYLCTMSMQHLYSRASFQLAARRFSWVDNGCRHGIVTPTNAFHFQSIPIGKIIHVFATDVHVEDALSMSSVFFTIVVLNPPPPPIPKTQTQPILRAVLKSILGIHICTMVLAVEWTIFHETCADINEEDTNSTKSKGFNCLFQ